MRRNDEVLQQDQQVRFEDVNLHAVIGKELARTKRYVDYEATLLGSNKKREVRWFFPDGDQDSQYKRIHVMLEKRSPSDHFRWPLATTCADTNGFGVLLYRRKGAALADVALGPQRPESLRTRIDIALEIVSRFSELHGSGWALEGFDGHELTVDIKNSWRAIFDDCGSVVRQDAVEDSERSGRVRSETIGGTSFASDRSAMSQAIHTLIFSSYPPCWPTIDSPDAKAARTSGDASCLDYERYITPVEEEGLKHWNLLSQEEKALFEEEEVVGSGSAAKMTTERVWESMLAWLRSKVLLTTCKHELLINDKTFVKDAGMPESCPVCEERQRAISSLSVPTSSGQRHIPVTDGMRIYRCMCEHNVTENGLDPVLVVVSRPGHEKALWIKNVSVYTIKAVDSQGKNRSVAPGGLIPIKPGVTISPFDVGMRIEKAAPPGF